MIDEAEQERRRRFGHDAIAEIKRRMALAKPIKSRFEKVDPVPPTEDIEFGENYKAAKLYFEKLAREKTGG